MAGTKMKYRTPVTVKPKQQSIMAITRDLEKAGWSVICADVFMSIKAKIRSVKIRFMLIPS
jgi:hypothetical protein